MARSIPITDLLITLMTENEAGQMRVFVIVCMCVGVYMFVSDSVCVSIHVCVCMAWM